MAGTITLDYETYSEVSVKDVGAEAYARHPSTDIICLSYSIDDAEPVVWAPWLPVPADLAVAIAMGYTFEAHHVAFERAISRHVATPRYGFPKIPDKSWRCTQAACAYKGVALKLEKGAQMLRLEQQKDMVGNAAMKWLSKPTWKKCPECDGGKREYPAGWSCPICDDGKVPVRREDFVRHEACADYCVQDVRTEIAIRREVGHLPPDELRVWRIDQDINQRGVLIDQELCHAAIWVAQQIEGRLGKEFDELTGGLTHSQRDKFLAWCNERLPGNRAMGSMTADEVALWLGNPDDVVPPPVRRALEIRQQLARSSVKKYQTALACVCPDGRARGMFQYHGAATGRWAGRLIQLQNMPRPSNEKVHMEDLVAIIKDAHRAQSLDFLAAVYGDPMIALADATRGMVIPASGHVFSAFDFSSIEAVVLACMFGETWKIEAFRRKECAYCLAAEAIFGHKVTKAEHPKMRQVGKTCELAFGYEGGVGAWRNFDSSDAHDDAAVNGYKNAWRAKHPKVKAGWRGLNDAALNAVASGGAHEYAGFRYEVEGEWLSCRLLSGRKLWYLYPRIIMAPMPWTDDDGDVVTRPQVEFTAWKEGQIKTVRGYGGHWTENVDQAISRDIMVAAMLKCEQEQIPIVLHAHDELVAEVPEDRADDVAKRMKEIMAEPLPWTQSHGGWPIRAEGGLLTRYQK